MTATSPSPAPPPAPEIARELHAAFDWWRLSGVDCDFADDVTEWLRAPEEKPSGRGADGDRAQGAQSPATRREPLHGARAGLRDLETPRSDLFGEEKPETLADFQRWWLDAPGLDTIGPRGRTPPRGPKDAELMVLVVDPEPGDVDVLLAGPQGELLANVLAAMGIPAERAYIASALPRHTPMADTIALAAGGMDDVTQHHIELASPQKLLALGTGTLPLLGLDAKEPDRYTRGTEGSWRTTPLLVSEGLDTMMAMPMLKARLWKRWIEWSQHT